MREPSGINNRYNGDLSSSDAPRGRRGWLLGVHVAAVLTLALGTWAVEPQQRTAITPSQETPAHHVVAPKVPDAQPRSAPVAIALADTAESALHMQVGTELVRRYECCVLNRMRGLTLSSEQRLDDLARIERLRERNGGVRASDFVVAIRHGTTERPNEVAFEIRFAEMKAPPGSSNAPPDKLRLASWDGAAQRLAETIARHLNLAERPALVAAREPPPTNEMTVVVFPFARFDKCPLNPTACYVFDVVERFGKASGNPRAPDIVDTLYLRSELAVQQEGNGRWRLADHVILEKVLTELKLTMISLADPASASALARMVSADRILLGGISSDGTKFRVDLHMIDAASTAVVGVESASCTTEAELTDTIATCTSNLLDRPVPAPVVLAASTKEQRRREAIFLLESSLSSVNSAEAAYMLAGDDQQVHLGMIRSTCTMIEGHDYFIDCGRPILVGVMHRLVAFNERLLADDDSPLPLPTPSPLVIRAEMCRRIKNFVKVRDLAQQQLRKYPRQDEARTLVLLAEAEEALGHIPEAKAALKQFLDKYDRGMLFWDVMHESGGEARVPNIERSIDEHGTDRRAAYQGLRQRLLDKYYRLEPGEWKTFLEQQREYEDDPTIRRELRNAIHAGPLHAVSGVDMEQSVLKAQLLNYEEFSWTWLYLAKCELRLGHKREAAREAKILLHMANEHWGGLRHLVAYPDPKRIKAYGNGQIERMCSRAKAIIDSVEAEIGPVDRLFHPFAATKAWPDKYSAYIVPVGTQRPVAANDDKNAPIKIGTAEDLAPITPESVARSFRMFYGARVAVLPAIPLSEELRKQRVLVHRVLSYDVKNVWTDILPRSQVPSDALYVVFLSLETYHTRNAIGDPWSPTQGNPILIGVDGFFRKRGSAILGFNAITAPRLEWGKSDPDICEGMLNVEPCESYPCIFRSRIDNGVREASDLACPKCQERFSRMDFDKIHQNLLAYLKALGATIIPVDDGAKPR